MRNGTRFDHQRNIVRVPAGLAQEQVLLFPEAEQRERHEFALVGPVEHDRVVSLHVAELGRNVGEAMMSSP
jgi:hypothetical protein